ncbi:MAG: N-acetyltransferase [Acidimicrobiales bacterium]
MTPRPLVPPGFEPPNPPSHPRFRFEPLGPEHNAADLDAWSSSIDHIHATPGFRPDGWPERPYTLAENLVDLEQHRDHHQRSIDFAWTVLDPTDATTVIGCVYLKAGPTEAADAEARSWARADRAELDGELREHLRPWFANCWPLVVRYAGGGAARAG